MAEKHPPQTIDPPPQEPRTIPHPTRQVAIVTGALGGIGRATVRRLLQDGWAVAASYAQGVGTATVADYASDSTQQDELLLHINAAVAFMTRQIAAEHVHTPMDVFAICPGATNTGMFQASTLNAMTDAERVAFIDRLPKQRLIEPEEIAELIAFLLTPHSRVLHGAVLDASMGLGGRPGLMTEMGH